jgi:hypothetical protein
MKEKNFTKKRYPLSVAFLVIIIMFSMFSANGQNAKKNVKGIVLDSNGNVLFGVNIIEKSIKNEFVSNLNGNYNISVNNGTSTLVFSYLGFLTQEVSVRNQTRVRVKTLSVSKFY